MLGGEIILLKLTRMMRHVYLVVHSGKQASGLEVAEHYQGEDTGL